jgi:hypothetical protein
MSTTFSELVSFSATLSGVATFALSNELRSEASGEGTVGAGGVGLTFSFTSGGVLYSALRSELSGTGQATSNLAVQRSLAAELSGQGTFRIAEGADTYFPALEGFGGDKLAASSMGEFPAFTGESSDPLLVPTYSFALGVMPAFDGEANGLSGSVGTADVSLYPLVGFSADNEYGTSSGTMPAMRSRANDEQTAFGPSVRGYLFSDFVFALAVDLRVEMGDTLESNVAMALGREQSAVMSEQLASSLAMQGLGEYALVMSDILQYISSLAQQRVPLVWVVNTEGGANSTYTGWDFNSFATWQGKNFAAGDDGLYELVGDTDDSAPIISSILTGKSDLGTVQLKRMAHVYVGATAEGGLTLIVHTDDGQVNEYEVSARELLSNSRTAIGKGLRSKYWQYELTNPDGGDFELESLELVPDVLQRRI